MKRGLLTLTIVAIALLCSSVYAYAPVIGNIPDIIIGDMEDNGTSCGLTDLNFFRFTDAFNFDEYVTAETGDPDAGTTYPQIVRWSFLATNTGLLKINGIATLADASESIEPGLKELTYILILVHHRVLHPLRASATWWTARNLMLLHIWIPRRGAAWIPLSRFMRLTVQRLTPRKSW
jgi:hypothetical protein